MRGVETDMYRLARSVTELQGDDPWAVQPACRGKIQLIVGIKIAHRDEERTLVRYATLIEVCGSARIGGTGIQNYRSIVGKFVDNRQIELAITVKIA